jgi:uncharacterized protein with PQ loop repeat
MLSSVFVWIGTIALVVRTIPQALQSIRQKHSDGINGLFLALFLLGELSYVVWAVLEQNPAIFVNNFISSIFTLIIIYYKLFPKRD